MAEDAETVSELLAAWAATKPDAPLFSWLEDKNQAVKTTQTLTYGDVEKAAARTAHKLRHKEGVKAGDRCLLVYEPGLAYIVAFLGVVRAGGIPVPVFPPEPRRRKTSELHAFCQIAESCGATFALTSSLYDFAKKITALSKLVAGGDMNWPSVKWVVCDIDKSTPGLPASPSSQEVAFLQFTSGSTSAPKGVVITHTSLKHNLDLIIDDLKADESTINVSWLPQYHDMGLIGSYLGTFRCGGRGYYSSPLKFVARPASWLEAIAQFRGTHTQAPNFAYALVTRKPPSKTLDLSSLQHAINAAEPVDASVVDAFSSYFGEKHGLRKGVVFPTYGLAESTVLVCGNGVMRCTIDADSLRERRCVASEEGVALVGCGAPRSDRGVAIKIVRVDDDDEGTEVLGENCVGEIWVRSPSVARGYWGVEDPSFGASIDGESGYLRTGDEGFFRDGELYVCGRRKDLIILRGKNHYPQDLERCAERAAPSLKPGCVAAFSVDDQGEEKLVVIGEVRDDASTRKKRAQDGAYASLCEQVTSSIAHEHGASVDTLCVVAPRTVPKTTSGKIARRRCRDAFLADKLDVAYRSTDGPTTAVVSEQPTSTYEHSGVVADVARALGKVSRRDASSLPSKRPLADLGVDSLDLAQFKGVLEGEFGLQGLPDDLLFRDDCTLAALGALVERGGAFTEEAYARAVRDLDVEGGGEKKKGDWVVENCACCLVCCPGKLR